MRVLVISGTGYIGSCLVRRLWADGDEVTVVARGLAPTALPPDVEVLRADRTVPGSFDAVLAGRRFDVVHDLLTLGAAFPPEQVAVAPRQVFALLGRAMGRYVLLSSSAVYAYKPTPIAEDTPLGPTDAYGRGKLAAEEAAATCARATGVPVTIVRPNEVWGPRDSTGRRAYHLFERVRAGAPLLLPGRLEVRLNQGYVEDTARLLALAGRSERGDLVRAYNASGPDTFTFEDHLAAIFSAVGRRVPVRAVGLDCLAAFYRWEGYGKVEWHLNCFADHLIDSTRAREELGWQPRVRIDEAMLRTWRWLERERPDLVAGPPQDLGAFASAGKPVEVSSRPAPEGSATCLAFGDELERSDLAAPAGPGDADAETLAAEDLCVLVPLYRAPEPLDLPQLLEEATELARAAGVASWDGALGHLAARVPDVAARGLADALDLGLPGYRVSARGYLALLAACARPPRHADAAPLPELALRCGVLLRVAYLRWLADARPASEVIDPYALGIPFALTDRTAEQALPAGVASAFASFEAFAAYFHAATEAEPALTRWLAALRLARLRLAELRDGLLGESRQLSTSAQRLLAQEGTRSRLVHQVQLAQEPGAPVEVLWAKQAELTRRVVVEPGLARLEASIAFVRALLRLARESSGDVLRGPPVAAPPPPPPGPSATLREGDPAPDFVAQSHPDGVFQLASLRGSWVVLYFYPMDDTTGCTAQGCRFRDDFSRYAPLGARVVGVSTDAVYSHAAFRAKYGLPFALVSDADKRIATAYGVLDLVYGWARRVTFLVRPDGTIAAIRDVQDIAGHSAEVLALLAAAQGAAEVGR